MITKSASIYLLNSGVLVQPDSKTTAGVWLASKPYSLIPSVNDHYALGQSVVVALGHSLNDIPHPTSGKGLSADRLQAAKVRSEREFMEQAELVTVELTTNGYTIMSYTNGGSKGASKGFSPTQAKAVSLNADCNSDALGSAIADAFSHCKSNLTTQSSGTSAGTLDSNPASQASAPYFGC